jgi:tetratricopeptide (TPR) repeat protein
MKGNSQLDVAGGAAFATPRRVAALALAFAFTGATLTRARIDRAAGRSNEWGPSVYITSGETLKKFSLGYSGLLADIYWTRAVQYFGRERLAGRSSFEMLAPLLRIATTLDPHLLIAYRFGAVFLAEKRPAGAGRPDEALELIRRGIAANPTYWRLWQDLGFIYYWDLEDYANAAQAFEEGSRQPGADLWMKTLAASVAARGGALSTSRILWSEVYGQAGNESIRRSAAQHLEAINAEEALGQLDRILAVFHQREGYPATSFADLVRAGLLARQPVDPAGVPFAIGKDGTATLGTGSPIDLRLAR